MSGKGSDTTDCSGKGRGCDGTSDVRRRVRAGLQSFLCGDQGGDCSVAGSGGCHTLWRTERGWGGRERTPGRGVLSSQRGEHSEVPRSARGDAHRRLLWRKGWGGAETAGRGPYQLRARALEALLGAPSWRRNESEPGRIPEGKARPRAPGSPRSRRQRSRSLAASCLTAGRGSRVPDPSTRPAPTGGFREQPPNKREPARITGAGSVCHHVRRRAGNTQREGTCRCRQSPQSPQSPNPLPILPARAWANSLPPARPRPRVPVGPAGSGSGGGRLSCAIPPARSSQLCLIGLPCKVPSPPSAHLSWAGVCRGLL